MASTATTALSASGRRSLSTWQSSSRPLCRECERHTATTPRLSMPIATSRNSKHHTAAFASSRSTARPTASPVAPRCTTRAASTHTVSEAEAAPRSAPATPDHTNRPELSSVTDMMAYLHNSTSKIFKNPGVPSEKDVAAALLACRVVADFIMDESIQPQIAHMIVEGDSATSGLLSLDQNTAAAAGEARRGTAPRTKTNMPAPTPAEVAREKVSAQLRKMVNKISEAAYAVVAHKTVFISPRLLEDYVEVQARLGKPETLPNVFHMYAHKPMASQSGSSPIQYTKQDPHSIKNAIEPTVIDKALDVAIEAKNLDAAVGIVENGYASKAYVRSKIARQALPPGVAFAATPVAAYALATSLSGFQTAMDAATATNVAFAGILAYVGFTASLGLVALTTANDQMKRVTWAPGVPLRKRWAREDQRAAMDKIACAWGFKETWRQGEEEGPQWTALHQFLGSKGMLLDRTDLMEGFD